MMKAALGQRPGLSDFALRRAEMQSRLANVSSFHSLSYVTRDAVWQDIVSALSRDLQTSQLTDIPGQYADSFDRFHLADPEDRIAPRGMLA